MQKNSLKFTNAEHVHHAPQTLQKRGQEQAKRASENPVPQMPNFHVASTPPKWSSSTFESDKWSTSRGNPARGRLESINFENLPEAWRRYAKLWFCAKDQIVEHGRGGALSFGTASLSFSVLCHFLKSVNDLEIKTLSALTKDQLQCIYLGYAKSGVSEITLKRYLAVLARSHHWGPSGLGVLDDGLSFDPAGDEFLKGKARQASAPMETPSLSEDVAQKLLAMAIEWVENRSEDVSFVISAAKLATRAKAAKAAKKELNERQEGLTVVQARKILEAHPDIATALATLPQRLGFAPRSLILEGHQQVKAGAEGIVADFMKIGLIAKKMHQIHQGFVYIICAGLNGWRSSEVFSVMPEGVRQTPAGFTLDSKIIKTATNRDDAVSRPVPEIVAKAVRSLAKINTEIIGLFPRKKGRHGLGLFKSTSGGDIDTQSVMEDINYAWKFFQGEDIGFRSHQFRKFFAHFFIRRFQGGADAVRWHFRHVSKEMVWAYAKDAMNAKQLVAAKKELAGEIVNSVVFGSGYASGHVGRDLKAVSSTLRLGARILTVEEAASFISSQVEANFVDIHAMEWGYCLFQNGDSGAACEARTGPIEARSEPATCGRCKFMCTGKENIAFWQQTALLHQEITAHPKATKMMKIESEKILSTAENILNRHSCDAEGQRK